MNCIIPFTKEVKFASNIAEIMSISLEHEYTVNETEMLGNFIITGEYKSHEVSVNREAFEFVLPFSVNLTKPIDSESVDFAIEDFTYELIDHNTLKVNIEYSIKAMEIERNEDVFESVSPEESMDAEEIMENALTDEIRETPDTIDETKVEENKEKCLDDEPTDAYKNETEDISQEENVILNAVETSENEFITYHIHLVKENETIESICSQYNTNSGVLENYNDLKKFALGEKLIIPEIDE